MDAVRIRSLGVVVGRARERAATTGPRRLVKPATRPTCLQYIITTAGAILSGCWLSLERLWFRFQVCSPLLNGDRRARVSLLSEHVQCLLLEHGNVRACAAGECNHFVSARNLTRTNESATTTERSMGAVRCMQPYALTQPYVHAPLPACAECLECLEPHECGSERRS